MASRSISGTVVGTIGDVINVTGKATTRAMSALERWTSMAELSAQNAHYLHERRVAANGAVAEEEMKHEISQRLAAVERATAEWANTPDRRDALDRARVLIETGAEEYLKRIRTY